MSSCGAVIASAFVYTASNDDTIAPSGNDAVPNWSSVTVPTTAQRHRRDDIGLEIDVPGGAARIEFDYSARFEMETNGTNSAGGDGFVAMLLRDSGAGIEVNAVAWLHGPLSKAESEAAAAAVPANYARHVNLRFVVEAPAAGVQTYYVAFRSYAASTNNGRDCAALHQRNFALRVY